MILKLLLLCGLACATHVNVVLLGATGNLV
jgi:hypothetical protein